MSSLPANFASMPGEEPHHIFRNICREFHKTLSSSKDIDKLQTEMERFLSASKDLNWHPKNSGVYHKQDADKAVYKVWTEFKRYMSQLTTDSSHASPQDLLDALVIVEQLVKSSKAT